MKWQLDCVSSFADRSADVGVGDDAGNSVVTWEDTSPTAISNTNTSTSTANTSWVLTLFECGLYGFIRFSKNAWKMTSKCCLTDTPSKKLLSPQFLKWFLNTNRNRLVFHQKLGLGGHYFHLEIGPCVANVRTNQRPQLSAWWARQPMGGMYLHTYVCNAFADLNVPMVTYSDPKVTYSHPEVTHSDPTLEVSIFRSASSC